MLALKSLRRRAGCSSISFTGHKILSSSISRLRTRPWQAVHTPRTLVRMESATTAQPTKTDALKYPEYLNVFRAGTGATVWDGIFRVASVACFGIISVGYTPAIYFSPDHSNILIPVIVLSSAIPWIVLTIVQGPTIHAIRVLLPVWARRSKEELLRFAQNTPGDTVLQLECIRFTPWPTKRSVRFRELRKITPSFKDSWSNLEHVPDSNMASEHKNPLLHWMMRRWLGSYTVTKNPRKDRSAAPGLWDKMWEQIPHKDDLLGVNRDPIPRPKTQVFASNRVTRGPVAAPQVPPPLRRRSRG